MPPPRARVHELSVALEVCRLAEDQVGRETCGQVVTVALDVGDEAGVDPSSLEFCLEALLKEPPFAGAVPLVTRCTGDVLRLSYLEVDDGRPDD